MHPYHFNKPPVPKQFILTDQNSLLYFFKESVNSTSIPIVSAIPPKYDPLKDIVIKLKLKHNQAYLRRRAISSLEVADVKNYTFMMSLFSYSQIGLLKLREHESFTAEWLINAKLHNFTKIKVFGQNPQSMLWLQSSPRVSNMQNIEFGNDYMFTLNQNSILSNLNIKGGVKKTTLSLLRNPVLSQVTYKTAINDIPFEHYRFIASLGYINKLVLSCETDLSNLLKVELLPPQLKIHLQRSVKLHKSVNRFYFLLKKYPSNFGEIAMYFSLLNKHLIYKLMSQLMKIVSRTKVVKNLERFVNYQSLVEKNTEDQSFSYMAIRSAKQGTKYLLNTFLSKEN